MLFTTTSNMRTSEAKSDSAQRSSGSSETHDHQARVHTRQTKNSVIDFFAHSATSQPKSVALLAADTTYTYMDLANGANRLAAHLQRLGIGPDRMVGLALDRSPQLIVSVLGILKAGGCYVPLDPSYPKDRLALMLEDAQLSVVITQSRHLPLFDNQGIRALLIEELDLSARAEAMTDSCPANPTHLCYVLFTSGSTGRPKGVAMHHGPLLNLISWQTRTSVLKSGARTLQFAPISFDVSFQELFTTFAQGGTLVLIGNEERLNAAQLLQCIRIHQVNRLIVPYVALQYLAETVEWSGEVPHSLKEVFTSGEQLKITSAISAFFARLPGCRFCNQYGPTEGHVVSELELTGSPAGWPSLPGIGRAIDNVELHILDEHMKPVRKGEAGELYLGGACVAKGYINRPELTAERFLEDSCSPGQRLYRTGDRVVESPDGDIYYKGRIDGQIKLHGFRVELGEIEVVLEAHPCVQQAIAVVREDHLGVTTLVAYYTAKGVVAAADLRKHMAQRLPEYMVPSAFVQLEHLPRTPSGKIDRKALRAPTETELRTVPYVAPRNPVEVAVAQIFSQALGIDRVGVHDDFFESGGRSLFAVQVIVSIDRAFKIQLPMDLLFLTPTVEALAKHLSQQMKSASNNRQETPTAEAKLDLTETERRVRDIWQKLMPDSAPIGLQDSLLVLQGDSDLLTPILEELALAYPVFIEGFPSRTFMEEPTIQTMARIVDENIRRPAALVMPLQPHGNLPPLFLIHASAGYVFFYRALASYLSPDRPVYGIRAETRSDRLGLPFDRSKSIEDLATRYIHAMKATHPKGPYVLGGACWGGVLAFEMARQLLKRGENIAGPVLLFDAYFLRDSDLATVGMERSSSWLTPLKEKLLHKWERASRSKVLETFLEFTRSAVNSIGKRIDLLRRMVWWDIATALNLPTPAEFSEPVLRQLFESAAIRTLRNYQPQIFDGRIVLFNASEGPDRSLDWTGLARDGMIVVQVPGEHLEMLDEPTVRATASLVREHLGRR